MGGLQSLKLLNTNENLEVFKVAKTRQCLETV